MAFGRRTQNLAVAALLLIIPLTISYYALGINNFGLRAPFYYGTGDDIWQLTLTKVLKDTGWVLWNPYLGAPEIASWHHNSAAQTSALHSVIMLAMSPFFDSAIALQQTYYLLNFPLICIVTYLCARQLSIGKLPAICASLLFAFCTYRFYFLIYAFLPNYFTVPLGLLITLWVLQGRFSSQTISHTSNSLIGRTFSQPGRLITGMCLTFIVGISDGYYAFFTLLLLGFAAAIRLAGGDWRSPKLLIPVVALIATLVASSLVIQAPLYLYKRSHHSEFYLNGSLDPVLTKQPFEAEVYSTSLKLLTSPIPQHHIDALATAGKYIYKTNLDARRFPAAPAVPLGTIGSALLLIALLIIIVPNLRRRIASWPPQNALFSESISLTDALLATIVFVFVTCIAGGLGTIIALIFPTIRAYDRFAIFLDLSLLLLGAHLASLLLITFSPRKKKAFTAFIIGLTAFGIYDQIPSNSSYKPPEVLPTYHSESNFVKGLEAVVPEGSMIYQYPYSNYLRNSKYYGWGSFSQVRLYLFSKKLHWSNGGAKNSPGDDWNYRISQLPFDKQVAELAALDFKAIVIDRTVVKDEEYDPIKQYLSSHGMTVNEDPAAHLSYALLNPSSLHIKYRPDYKSLVSVTVDQPDDLKNVTLPSLIDRKKFFEYLSENHTYPIIITSASYPDLFIDSETLTKGNGDRAIAPVDTLHATLTCTKSDNGQGVIQLNLANNGPFNLSLAQGSFPLNIGVHVVNERGEAVLWDNGTRVSAPTLIKSGETGTMTFNVNAFPDLSKALETSGNSLEFELVQDANSWFAGVSCKVLP
jgi:hypothetical protein